MRRLYLRLLGARVGRDVHVEKLATLGEFDLLDLGDRCRIDNAVVRGFCVEKNGYFTLAPITIGEGAIINTFTQISPGAIIAPGAVYGPHASSHDEPLDARYANYNRASIAKPQGAIQMVFVYLVFGLVLVVSWIPWIAAIYAMIYYTVPIHSNNILRSVIWWFADHTRIVSHQTES